MGPFIIQNGCFYQCQTLLSLSEELLNWQLISSVQVWVKPAMWNNMVSKSAQSKTAAMSVDCLVCWPVKTILKMNSFEQIYWYILLLLLQGGHKRSPHGAIWPGMHPIQPSWAVLTLNGDNSWSSVCNLVRPTNLRGILPLPQQI